MHLSNQSFSDLSWTTNVPLSLLISALSLLWGFFRLNPATVHAPLLTLLRAWRRADLRGFLRPEGWSRCRSKRGTCVWRHIPDCYSIQFPDRRRSCSGCGCREKRPNLRFRQTREIRLGRSACSGSASGRLCSHHLSEMSGTLEAWSAKSNKRKDLYRPYAANY